MRTLLGLKPLVALIAFAATLAPAAPSLAQPPGEIWLACTAAGPDGRRFPFLFRVAGAEVFYIDDNGGESRANGGGTVSASHISATVRRGSNGEGHFEWRFRINRFDGTFEAAFHYITNAGRDDSPAISNGSCERQASPRF